MTAQPKALQLANSLETPSRGTRKTLDEAATELRRLHEENKQLKLQRKPLTEWQPIETAPEETEVFIGAFIDGVFKFGRSEMFYEQGSEFAGETWSGWIWSVDDCADSVAESPTHWMPLPPEPTPKEKDQIEFRDSNVTDRWVMRITADRRIEVNEDVEVTEAAKKVLEAMQHLLAQRTWVGLTDEEISEAYTNASKKAMYGMGMTREDIYEAIEAKLKEKNRV